MSSYIYKRRRSEIMAKAAASGIGNIVISNPSNILYFTGVKYNTLERFKALFLNVFQNEAYLVLPAMEKGRLEDTSIEEVTYKDGTDAVSVMCTLFTKGERIAFEKAAMQFNHAELIHRYTGTRFEEYQDIDDIVKHMRLIKSQEEIEALKEAGRRTDRIVQEWSKNISAGVSEEALRFELTCLMSRYGEKFGFETQISSGVNSSISHGIVKDRNVLDGEQVLIDFGVLYQEYHADITRTYFAGQPQKRFADIYQIVSAAQQAAIERIRPGVEIKEVDLAARNVIESAGYGEFFMHRTGHGIGLDIHEAPDICSNSELLLEQGMTFTVEPGIYLPGIGGVRIEDDVLVTDVGCLLLTSLSKKLDDMILG